MVKQKKRTCITQSGKNYAINWNAWFVTSFCTELTLVHCFWKKKNCTALDQSEWRNFFMYIMNSFKMHTVKPLFYLTDQDCIWELGSSKLSGLPQNVFLAVFARDNIALPSCHQNSLSGIVIPILFAGEHAPKPQLRICPLYPHACTSKKPQPTWKLK